MCETLQHPGVLSRGTLIELRMFYWLRLKGRDKGSISHHHDADVTSKALFTLILTVQEIDIWEPFFHVPEGGTVAQGFGFS